MRRIGQQTFLNFKIRFRSKLLEILPNYNKLFDALENWNIFSSGEKTTETTKKERTQGEVAETSSEATTTDEQDLRFSKLPQNAIQDVKNGSHLTEYNFNKNDSTDRRTGEASRDITENSGETRTLTREDLNKMDLYQKFIESKTNIMTMIFNDLDCLFYGIEEL